MPLEYPAPLKNAISNSDYDSEVSVDDGTSVILEKLSRPLFSVKQSLVRDNTSVSGDADNLLAYGYAVTINICPNKKMNKKVWKTYSHEQQSKILLRIESAMRRDNPSIKLTELHLEICPSLQQIHLHALYDMPELFVSTMEAYWQQRVADIRPSTIPWRYIDISKVRNRNDWLQYIRKDII